MSWLLRQKVTILTVAWTLILSVLTVLKVAPDGLNADILLNSVMSLQNVTLYYWGQNRLLNVLPLAVTLVKNPDLNLAVALALTSACFYGLLYLLSRVAAMLVGAKDERELSFRVFVATASLFVWVFTSHTISEIVIGHIEYSLAFLLLVIASLQLARWRGSGSDWRRLILPGAAIFLAIGLNPSTAIPAFCIAMFTALYKKKVSSSELALLAASGVAFIAWNYISRQFGKRLYYAFRLEVWQSGLQSVAANLWNQFDVPVLLLLVAAGSAARIGYVISSTTRDEKLQPLVSYVTRVVVLCSIGWVLLFSCSKWVETNNFAWRYFTYVLFAVMFLCALYLARHMNQWTAGRARALTGVGALASVVLLGSNVTRLHFDDYNVFQRIDALSEPGDRLYAGDYWVVWPSVLRDMRKGHESYGLAYRGEANKVAARKCALRLIKENGRATVYCLNDTVQSCLSQVDFVAGPLFALDSTHHGDGVTVIHVAESAPFLDVQGADFLNLPAEGGVDGGGTR